MFLNSNETYTATFLKFTFLPEFIEGTTILHPEAAFWDIDFKLIIKNKECLTLSCPRDSDREKPAQEDFRMSPSSLIELSMVNKRALGRCPLPRYPYVPLPLSHQQGFS